MKTQQKLVNSNNTWDAKRRYKINAIVTHNGLDWQNTTGINSEPSSSDSNWICISWDKRPYKVYSALLTQTGTSAPTKIELENTLEATCNINRASVGIYTISFSSNVLINNKSTILINSFDNNGRTIYAAIIGVSSAQIITRNSGATIDGVLDNTTLEIRVYN